MLAFSFFLYTFVIADHISISVYIMIMCVILCLFSALSHWVGALQISVIIIIKVTMGVQIFLKGEKKRQLMVTLTVRVWLFRFASYELLLCVCVYSVCHSKHMRLWLLRSASCELLCACLFSLSQWQQRFYSISYSKGITAQMCSIWTSVMCVCLFSVTESV